jgi:hypothetical protein
MSELQKIALGLLGMTHPEIALIKQRAEDEQPQTTSKGKALLRALKFTFAALVVGSRVVPMGDNAHLVGELCAHAARLHTDA